MPFRHGQSAVVLWDEFDLSPFLNAATVSGSMEPAEVTNFGSGCDREFIKGLRDVTVSLEGFYSVATTAPSTEITDILDDAFTGTTSPVITIGLEDDSTGRRAWLIKGDAVSYDIDSPVDDVIGTSVDIQGSQGYYGGRWLVGRLTSTSTGSGGGIIATGTTGVGGTTGGGVAHLHVTAERNVTTATFRVQHSTSGSTWANLITFTNATGKTFQRSTVAGTVKERVRGSLTSLTEGATGGSITWSMAFARYGPSKA